MPVEQFSNQAQTTLSAAVTSNTATSISVTSASAFPTGAGQFRILVDSEIMLVTAGQGTTNWTVTRAVEAVAGVQTATTHSSGATVSLIFTSGAFSNAAASGSFPVLAPGGLTGATQPTRYVGGTTSGAPTSGAFLQGDFVIDLSGTIWICTSAGSPGSWASPAPQWQTYTPTWSSTGGTPVLNNGTLQGTYRIVGKEVDFFFNLIFGSTTNGATGAYTFSLPPGLTAIPGLEQNMPVKIYSSYPSNWVGVAYIAPSGTTLYPYAPLAANTSALGQVTQGIGAAGCPPGGGGLYTFQSGYNMSINGKFLIQ